MTRLDSDGSALVALPLCSSYALVALELRNVVNIFEAIHVEQSATARRTARHSRRGNCERLLFRGLGG